MRHPRQTHTQFMDALATHLEVPVTLNLAHLATLPAHMKATCIEIWRAEGAAAIATHGDALQFTTKKPGRTATAFNSLAKGIAALATTPEGIHFAGRHWTTDEKETGGTSGVGTYGVKRAYGRRSQTGGWDE